MYELDKTNNSVYSLNYHFITVVKYRKHIFDNDDIVNDIKLIFNRIAESFDVKITAMECGVDHIHVLFRAKPSLDITKFINILKGHSSRDLRKKYSDVLKDKLWGDAMWSPSYFLSTTGNVSLDTLKNYIDNQRTLSGE